MAIILMAIDVHLNITPNIYQNINFVLHYDTIANAMRILSCGVHKCQEDFKVRGQ